MIHPLPIDCARHPAEVAPELIGLKIVHVKGGRLTAGRIVEVEAYGGEGEDDCAHAHRGLTPRNRVMFGPPGRLYVYFTYGMHYCANIVAHPHGHRGGAVLLRALEPTDGIGLMRRRRRTTELRLLCSGPARLVQALGLGRRDDGRIVGTSTLWLEGSGASRPHIVSGVRIGVNCEHRDRLWRFAEADSQWLSKALR